MCEEDARFLSKGLPNLNSINLYCLDNENIMSDSYTMSLLTVHWFLFCLSFPCCFALCDPAKNVGNHIPHPLNFTRLSFSLNITNLSLDFPWVILHEFSEVPLIIHRPGEFPFFKKMQEHVLIFIHK